MGMVWAQLWKLDPKQYLPFLTSGMICWVLFASFINEGCVVFVAAEGMIKQLRSRTCCFVCAMVWAAT